MYEYGTLVVTEENLNIQGEPSPIANISADPSGCAV
jgi:hypothetical protein